MPTAPARGFVRHTVPTGDVHAPPAPAPRPHAPAGALAAVFTGTIFLNAFLLFLVEPMFGKMVLPLLGGTANVWNTCMLFFQAALLGGYLYAHALARWLPARAQAVVHVALLAAATAALPVVVGADWVPPAAGSPVPWLVAAMATSLGAPFLLLSAGAPLLQHWFARTRHASAHNPYFLYAASNLGSAIALLSYPFLVEPRLRLAQQARAWALGYDALALLVAACAVAAWRARGAPAAHLAVSAVERAADTTADDAITTARRVRWVLLAFAPSSLLLGVTTYLTTDVAAIPLLWIVPLLSYLLTFSIAFARRPLISRDVALTLQALTVGPVLLSLFWGRRMEGWAPFVVHLPAFFVAALVCHGELARTRPAARHLTEFYVWISIGGALGGAFNVLVAPRAFTTVLEYPIAIVLACALRPSVAGARARRDWRDLALPALLALTLVALVRVGEMPWAASLPSAVPALALVVAAMLASRGRPLRFALSAAAVLLAGGALRASAAPDEFTGRSFFGVSRVRLDPRLRERLLLHGTTLHGGQSLVPAERRVAPTYFSPGGPIGDVFRTRPPNAAGRRVGIVGLGAGAMAAYAAPGDRWTFYEIDPVVARIATDPRYFTYLGDAPAATRVVLGDARLSLAHAPAGGYDLLVLDAFTSDVIPVHLITREALRLYLAKLAEGGALAFNVSSAFFDVEPVLAALARDARLVGRLRDDPGVAGGTRTAAGVRHLRSRWLVLARREADLGALATDPRWRPLRRDPAVRLWTDDYSDVVSVLRRPRS